MCATVFPHSFLLYYNIIGMSWICVIQSIRGGYVFGTKIILVCSGYV